MSTVVAGPVTPARLPSAPPVRRVVRFRPDRRLVSGALGFAGLLLVWTLLAVARPALIPTPVAVLGAFVDNGDLIAANTLSTTRVAALGWLAGNAIAVALGVFVLVVPRLEASVLRLAAVVSFLPALAIGPVLYVLLDGDTPKIVISALGVVLTTVVGTVVGLRAVSPTVLDVVRATGGGLGAELRFARIRAGLPSLLASLRIAGPAAVLGAIIGEYLGGSEGLGPAMMTAQQQLNVPLTWALALAATAVAGIAYAVPALVNRWTSPWAATVSTGSVTFGPATPAVTGWRRLLGMVGGLVAAVTVTLAVWWAAVELLQPSPMVAKTPADVARFLFAGDRAADHRAVVFDALGQTLSFAAVGYLAGTVAALLLVAVLVRFPALEYVAMPPAIVLQSVPLGVFTPIFMIVFGRGLFTAAAICGAVTFFPTLVMTLAAVRAVPSSVTDVFRASGASATRTFLCAQIPAALPALLAAARIAVPAAVVGALLVEWLATGTGLGYLMLRSTTTFAYDQLWAAVVVCTLTMIAAYTIVTALESWVLARMGD
ncbi:ABC transporter permease [Rhodococcus rhodochrous]|uniref:ABC transporter permease subunit n=1 Tax=Rhodococcus rhodochrous TaxID=1829 RepID=A0AA46WS17_RHORH|nr:MULTISPECIES: ABC transporter permease subunit [Rhodococcus]MDJ0398288.1 ABC transporter permease subunit [Rhodococcus rhodochrous]MDO1482447.1 ABC transporter permease subunit [Rhodococcus rhodochrous]UZF43258.1 ABC transporter permease subunit [Rhodococcus rhodochrous]WSE20846.1 ABC transporter permease subunit [Rhodococcus sp. PD04]SNV20823.1 ABC transporter permease [Rhodococcus rhodochrous]